MPATALHIRLPNAVRAALASAFFAGMAAFSPVLAQDAPSAIEIDRSVLDQLDPHLSSDPAPVNSGHQNKLTPPPILTDPGIVSFPIEMNIRSGSGDPSLRTTPLADRPPVPPKKPVNVPAAHTMAMDRKASPKRPPIPPHRPQIQHASAHFVAQARANYITDLSAGKGDGSVGSKRTMPALPKDKIAAEPLSGSDLESDSLASRLVSPTAQELANSLEPRDAVRMAATAPAQRQAETGHEQQHAAAGTTDGPAPVQTSQNIVTIAFDAEATALDEDMKQRLGKTAVSALLANHDLRVEIQAFATAATAEISDARRISLARALAVRGYLLDQGILPARINVRPLGSDTDRLPRDRVDLTILDSAAE